jgi:hypothetical protein
MLYAGLDLSRKRLDFHVLDAEGTTVEVGASPPDGEGVHALSPFIGSSVTARRSAPDRVDERRPLRASCVRAYGRLDRGEREQRRRA